MDFEHAARRKAAQQRGADLCGIDAALARQCERLADGGQRAADDELIARLADLAGAGLADVDDPLRIAHRFEDRPHRLDRSRVAADHDRERAVDGADLAAADRRVEQRRAARRCIAASRRAVAGEIVLMSTMIAPG